MAKNLLLTVLVKVLGKYVEGLTNENLEFGVFSGQLEFNNLTLKDSALDQLELPIQVKKGCLKHLHVSIPWTQLESKPVEIEIDGVYLLATPLDISQCTPEKSRKMVNAMKQKKLEEIQDFILLTIKQEEGENAAVDVVEVNTKESSSTTVSYVQQLITSIVDNLEVKLRNIHIRYEDSNADDGQLFCLGVSLDEFLLNTCDEFWNTKFVKRDMVNADNASQSAVYKIGKIINCGVYWNSFGHSHMSMSIDEWNEFFEISMPRPPKSVIVYAWQRHKKNILYFWLFLTVFGFLATGSFISVLVVTVFVAATAMRPVQLMDDQVVEQKSPKGQFIEEKQYILSPPNNLILKLTQRMDCTEFLPKVDMLVESSEMPFTMDKDQLRQLMALKKSFGDLDRKLQMAMFRPALRPKQNASAREWWKYAYRLVTGRDISLSNKMNIMSACMRKKDRYIYITKENYVKTTLAKVRGEKPAPQYQDEIRSIEDLLPLGALAIFREEALRLGSLEISNHQSKKMVVPQSTVDYISSWFGSISDSDRTDHPDFADKEDLALMGTIETKLQRMTEDCSVVANQVFPLRIAVRTSSTLSLTYNRIPFAKLQMALSFGMEMRYGNMSMKLGMDNFSIEDICSAKPYNKYLVCMAAMEDISSTRSGSHELGKKDSPSRSQFELFFDIEPTKSVMLIRALPLIITWNKHCLQHLLGFVILGTADDSYVSNNPVLKETYSAESAMPETDLLIKIDIDAPKIILPEDMGNSERCTILDTGTLTLDGLLNACGMKWDIKLKNINIAMPVAKNALTITSDKDDLYLIKPFDISAILSKNDKESSELSVFSRVDPELRAEFTPEKIVRLGQAVAALLSGLNSDKAEVRTKRARSSMIASNLNSANYVPPTRPTPSANPTVNIDKEAVGLGVTFLLNKLALRLSFSSNNSHFIEIAFTKIEYKLYKRLFDDTMTCTLNSLTIFDSQRPIDFPYLILAQSDVVTSDLSNLFTLTLRSFSSKNSSFYGGNAMDMSITISVINLYLDDKATLGYKSLVDELINAYNVLVISTSPNAAKKNSSEEKINNRNVKKLEEGTPPHVISPLGGSLFDFSLERVSLHILNSDNSNRNIGQNPSEIAFSLNVNDLHLSYQMHDLSKGFAKLHSVDIIDLRSLSSSPAFRALLSSSGCENQHSFEVSERNKPQLHHQEMLEVDFKQYAVNVMSIEVKIMSPKLVINLDVILDLVAIVMVNVDAWLNVLSSIQSNDKQPIESVVDVIEPFTDVKEIFSSDEEDENDSGNPNDIAVQSESVVQDDITIRLHILDPQLLLIENPESPSSRAIVGKSNIGLVYRKVFTCDIQESEEKVSLTAEESQLIVVRNLSAPHQIHRIIDPTNLHVDFTRRSEKDVLLELKVVFCCLSDVFIRVSLNDLVLAGAIVGRMTSNKEDPNIDGDGNLIEKQHIFLIDDPIDEVVDDSRAWKPPAFDSCIYEVLSTVTKVTVVLINDCNSQNNPLLRLEIDTGVLRGGGPLLGFCVEGSIFVNMDYYNIFLNVWEPVIERWMPSMSLTKDSKGTNLLLKNIGMIQLNVTGTLLKCITNAISLVSRSQLNVITTRSIVAPLKFSNQLGIAVELFDAAKDISIMRLDDGSLHELLCPSDLNDDSALDWSRPRILYMCFRDDYEGLFTPLRQLSTATATKPKIYHLQPSRQGLQSSPYSTKGKSFAEVAPSSPHIVWEVICKPDESREIFIRTTKVIVNDLGVDIEFSMGSIVSSTTFIIKKGARRCIPLKSIHEQTFRIRPVNTKCTWTEGIPLFLDPNRKDTKSPEFCQVSFFDEYQVSSKVGIMSQEVDGLFVVTCYALMEVINRLPCDLNLAYKNISKKLDQVSLSSGETKSLFNFESGSELEIVPMIGGFSKTEKIKLPAVNEDVDLICKLVHERSGKCLFYSLRVSVNSSRVVTLLIYSKVLLCDRTDLSVSVATGLGDRKEGGMWEAVSYNTTVSWNELGILPSSSSSNDRWIYGMAGQALLQPLNGKFLIMVNRGSAQTNQIDMESLSTAKSKIDVYDASTNRTYSIAAHLMPYPTAPDLSRVLHVTPAFHVINAMRDQTLFIQQSNGDGGEFPLEPLSARAWHAMGKKTDSTDIIFRTTHSDWSIGKVDINDIGTSVILLPKKQSKVNPNENEEILDLASDPVVLNIDVRFSASGDPSYITITVWESKIWRDPISSKFYRLGTISFSIRNATNETIIVRQNSLDVVKLMKKLARWTNLSTEDDAKRFELIVPPGEWRAYGWADQDLNSKMDIAFGCQIITNSHGKEEYSFDTAKNVVTIPTEKVGHSVRVNSRISVQVKTNAHGKFLQIGGIASPTGKHGSRPSVASRRMSALSQDMVDQLRINDFNLRLELDCVAVSMIADRPNRREFLTLYLHGIQSALTLISASEFENATTMLSFTVQGAQIDNYSQSVIYPVLLTTTVGSSANVGENQSAPQSPEKSLPDSNNQSGVGEGDDETMNTNTFIYFMLVQESPKEQQMSIIKYLGFRMLETRISIDSASILLYMSDLHRDLLEGLAGVDSEGFSTISLTESFNSSVMKELSMTSTAEISKDIYRECEKAQTDKIVIESLEIHPIKVVINFSPSHYPRSKKEIPAMVRWMTKIETVSPVEDFAIKIKSFKAQDAMESVSTLTDRILQKIINDFTHNLISLTKNLILSMNALGKPAGLYKKIGSGVEDFFYEPYQGLTKSPIHFVKGIGIGTGKLLKGVGGGVVGSTATIVTTATGGVALVARNMATLTGDKKFIQRNEEKRREMMTNNGGALAGFKAAGESVFGGISSGLSGLVTSPIEETKKSGAMGFFVGVGKGLVGAAVKPVIGVTEGIANVATGINHQLSNALVVSHRRPARAFFKPEVLSSDLVLVPLDLFAAIGQQLVNKIAFKKNYSDTFLAAFELPSKVNDLKENDPAGLVFSMKYVMIITKSLSVISTVSVSTLSHVSLYRSDHQNYTLEFVEYSTNQKKGSILNSVKISTRNRAILIYDTFVRYRTLFGCPTAMPPSEVVMDMLDNDIYSQGSGKNRKLSLSESDGDDHPEAKVIFSSSVGSTMNGESYIFGTANEGKCTKNRFSDVQFKKTAKIYLSEVDATLPITEPLYRSYHASLDKIVWRSVFDWTYNHDYIINPSRCCACLIINHSNALIEIENINLKEGVEVIPFSVGPEGFDAEKNIVSACGGAVLLFGYGRRPTIVSKEHIKFEIHSNAFRSLVSTRVNSSNLHTSPGFNVNFMEKTRTDWWAKVMELMLLCKLSKGQKLFRRSQNLKVYICREYGS